MAPTLPRLIYNPADWVSFNQAWIRPIVQVHFDLVPYDPAASYTAADTVLVTYVEYAQANWFHTLQAQGSRVVVDHLWDSDVDCPTQYNDAVMTLRNGNWLWYYSCIEWQYHGYDQYQPRPDPKWRFFMPMNRQEWHRDLAVKSLATVLDQALYSYQAQGRSLPQDTALDGPVAWRSYFDPEWYNSTVFSVVAESYMRSSDWQRNPTDPHKVYKTEVSEKIFKPIMGQHPFIVFGSVDTLAYLRREGFVTYDNIIDESYDTVINDVKRHATVTDTVIAAVNNLHIDTETQARIDHNLARLFDRALVNQRFRTEIIDPILEFVL